MSGEEWPRILLVDDEPPILASLRRLMAFEPWTVMATEIGAQALEVLAAGNVAVILTDQHMPGMEGVELLRRARELAPDTTRILFSGHIDIELLRSAVNGGEVYRFVTKPWDDGEVLTAVRHGIERWHLLRQNRMLRERTERQNGQLRSLNKALEELVASRTAALDLRTRALMLSQEVLDRLPVAVVGFDGGGSPVITNRLARDAFPWIADGGQVPAEFRRIFDQAVSTGGAQATVACAFGHLRCEATSLADGEIRQGVMITATPVAPDIGSDP